MTTTEPEFLEIFRDEARERLDRMVNTLLALEAGRADAGAVDSLFRDIHTIKGAAGMIGLTEVCALAHAMEDVLSVARDGGELPAGLVAPLLRAGDELRRHVEGAGEPVADLVDELALQGSGAAVTIAPGPAPAVAIPEDVLDPATPPRKENGEAREAAERRSIRVPAEKIDTLLDLVGETVLHRRRLEHALGGERAVRARRRVCATSWTSASGCSTGSRTPRSACARCRCHRSWCRSRARFATWPPQTGKEVELVIDGVETELDRAILEGLSEILVHLLRNAIAHGIEPPGRARRGRQAARGDVELRAEQRGGLVEIDGRRRRPRRLRGGARRGRAARARSPTSSRRPASRRPSEVDDISGPRGRPRRRQGQGGVARRGARGAQRARARHPVVLRAALALALMRGDARRARRQRYGLPLASVEEVVSLGEQALARRAAGDRGARALHAARGPRRPDGRRRAAAGRRAPRSSSSWPRAVASPRSATPSWATGGRGQEPRAAARRRCRRTSARRSWATGASRCSSTRSSWCRPPAHGRAPRRPCDAPPTAAAEVTTPKVLVVEDQFTMRELQRSILEAAGYRVQTARDGREALEHWSATARSTSS